MNNVVIFPYTGFCPHINASRTVDIEYFELRKSMSTQPGYKRKNILCSEKANCPYFDTKHGCPLYQEAQRI